MLKLEDTQLYKRLDNLERAGNSNAILYKGKIEELMPLVEEVLSLVRAVFPHYTGHSIDHSINIIFRIGQLLPKSIAHIQPRSATKG